MRRIIIILFILVLVFMNTGDLYAQSQKNINEATNIINNRGIRFYDPDYAFTLFDDFFTSIADSLWQRQTIGGQDSLFSLVDTLGGVLKITTSPTENMGTILKTGLKCFTFDTVTHKEVWVEAYFSLSEVKQMDFIFGIGVSASTMLDSLKDQIGAYFFSPDGTDTLWAVNNNGSGNIDTTQITALIPTDSTFYKMKVYFNGNDIRYFINGRRYVTHSTWANFPSGTLQGVFGYVNGAAAIKYAYLDYFLITQVR